MVERLLKFVTLEQQTPDKRAASARARDFAEIYARFAPEQAGAQASRCSQCGVPFCQVHCPLHNNIPDWLKAVAEGRLEEAYALSAATNSMPEICGRICPQDRLCEGNCVIEQSTHGAVTIGSVETYITETAWAEGWVAPIRPRVERARSVGVVGAGPAGLAAAEALRVKGWKVTVYDRYDRAGGLLIYGIPGFKLEKHIVTRRAERLAESGVEFRLNFEVGRDATLDDLRARHDAVLLATGVYAARDLKIPGVGAHGVLPAMRFLTASNRKGLGDAVPEFDDGALNAAGKHVVVIGGGDTAMDCVRTAVRQGAASVRCLYRRDRENMPGSMREVANAEEEGVEFVWLSTPRAFLTDDDNRVNAVRVTRMRLGLPDASGRQTPTPIEGGDTTEPCDMAILALGFEPEDLPTMMSAPALATTRWGTVKTQPGQLAAEGVDGVYAAGDIVRGASLVVWAIRDGRDAAAEIHARLMAMDAAGDGGEAATTAASRAAAVA